MVVFQQYLIVVATLNLAATFKASAKFLGSEKSDVAGEDFAHLGKKVVNSETFSDSPAEHSTHENFNRNRRALSGLDLYHLIADTSGGHVYETDKTNIGAVADLIKESVSTKPQVTVLKFLFSGSMSNDVQLPVDDQVANLTIKLQSTSSRSPSVTLYTPKGTQQSFGNKSVATMETLGTKLLVIKLFSPEPGSWRLHRTSALEQSVDVTANTDVDFTYKLMTPGPDGFGEYPLVGRPIAGMNTSVQVSVPAVDEVASVDKLLLLNDSGSVMVHADLVNVGGRRGKTLFRTHVSMPFDDFCVATEGRDNTGNTWRRLNPIKVSTLAIQLQVLPASGTLFVNQIITIPFVVRNVAGASSRVDVTIGDDKGFVQAPTTRHYSLSGHHNASGSFTLRAGTTVGVTTTVTVSAKSSGAPDSQVQYSVHRITVEEKVTKIVDTTPPSCNITSTVGKCDVGADVCRCSNMTWEMTSEIGDVGDGLYSVFPSGAGNSSNFTHDSFKPGHALTDGKITATFSTDCCHLRATITVVDLAGNVGLCDGPLNPTFVPPDPKLCQPHHSDANNTDISCNVTDVISTCNASAAASEMPGCLNFTWSFTSRLGNETLGAVHVVAVNAGSGANLTQTRDVVNLSTDCCHPSVTIKAVDGAGNLGQCHARVTVAHSDQGAPPVSSGSSPLAAIVGGTVGGVVIVSGVIATIVYLSIRTAPTKVSPISEVGNKRFKIR